MSQENLVSKLQSIINAKHLLQHPFYQHWEKGTLPKEILAKYAEQYYHLERNFPRFLSQIHTNCDEPAIRQTITENLYDEEHGEANHRELWLRFAESVGASREAVQASTPLPETLETLNTFTKLSQESTLAGVSALAAYEHQIPAVSMKKIAGLQKNYGITDERGLAFFRVHGTMDIAHANAWWNIIKEDAITPTQQSTAEQAVTEGRDALWNFLTGICRAYFPEALASC